MLSYRWIGLVTALLVLGTVPGTHGSASQAVGSSGLKLLAGSSLPDLQPVKDCGKSCVKYRTVWTTQNGTKQVCARWQKLNCPGDAVVKNPKLPRS
jgi:hypothetical protein